jgi:hypothetical protein
MLAALSGCAAPAAPRAVHTPEPVTLLSLPGSADGRYPREIETLTRGAAGRLYLAAGGSPLAVFPPAGGRGEYLRGASGDRVRGFQAGWMGDTLAMGGFDSWELFAAGGRAVGCRPFEQVNNEFATQVFARHPLPGGLTLGELTPPWPDPRQPEALVVSRGQTVVRTLHRRPSGPYRVEVPFPWGGGSSTVVVPFTARTEWAVSDNGAHVVVVESAQPAGPGPHSVRVLRMDAEGRVAYDVRLTVPARPVSDDERAREIDEWARDMAGGTLPRDVRAARDAFRARIRFPDYHPAVTALLVSRDGAAWLRLPDAAAGAVWMRLGPGGTEDLRLSLPATFRPAYADPDALWGQLPEPGGGLRVVAYPLPGRPSIAAPGFSALVFPADPPPAPQSIVPGRC